MVDLLVVDGTIAGIGEGLDVPEGTREIEAGGLVLTPGFIDLHCHLREPGREDEETVATGCLAAVAGGFTAVCSMPNTDPVTDSPASVGFICSQARAADLSRVYPVAAASVGSRSERMTEVGDLVEAGAVGVSDDGRPVESAALMRRLLEYTQAFDIPVVNHCEDLAVSAAGVMNEGLISTRLGLPGIPRAAEEVMVARDLALADLTGGRLHLAHLSTARAVEMVREAKARGAQVTAEATPHHLVLTEEACLGYNTQAKVNPPLRGPADVAALRRGLADGTIDAVATDHAPHHYDEKERDFQEAPFGMVGLETALALLITELVDRGELDLSTLVARLTIGPARAFGLPGGSLEVGGLADLTLFDPSLEWVVDPQKFLSRSSNTPLAGRTLRGKVLMTVVGGRVVWDLGVREKQPQQGLARKT